MQFIITVGREHGTGGRFIAQNLANKLGIKFYDDALLEEAAKNSGLATSVFEAYDEQKETFFTGMGGDLSLGQKVFIAQFDAIKKIANSGESCVIVGRCADYVLREYPNVINIFICAPLKARIEHTVKYYGVTEKNAEAAIIKYDKKRKKYYNFYTDKDWGVADTYDLCVNASIGSDETVDAIIAYVEARLKTKLV